MGSRKEAGTGTDPRVTMAVEVSGLLADRHRHYDELLDRVAQLVCRDMGDLCIIGLLSHDRRRLHPLGLHHRDPAVQRRLDSGGRLVWDSSSGVTERVLSTGEPSVFPSAGAALEARDRLWLEAFIARVKMQSAIVAAMRASGERRGIMAVARGAGAPPLSAQDVPFLQGIADRLALVIENMLLREELDRLRRPVREELPDPRLSALTERESEILRLIGEGLTNRDIGERLYLSVRTVEWHRARLSAKLDARKRSTLIALGRTLIKRS